IGLLFSAVALLISVRGLVMNQGAPRELERKIRDAAREVPEVKHVIGMQTTMVGSDKLLANIDVHLKDGLNTDQVEEVVEKVKEATEQTSDGLQVHVEPDAVEDAHGKNHTYR
ncbi:MAG TPA: cation transporter dimerization domain-containing protein, partial [Patescibacteria group bacterium]|nr:cation transporter dimerization domain-containing protein [Patescibacteria group bacterium]